MKKLLLFLILGMFCISMVSAGAFDFNKKSFNPEVGKYGKVIIDDWWGLGRQVELQLTENTEKCIGGMCEAKIPEFIMYEKGVLIEDIRFVGDQPKEYSIYVNNKLYEIGTQVNKGTYDVRIEGELKILQETDWQIKVGGIWIDEWALWSTGSDILSYYDFGTGSGTNVIDLVDGLYNLTIGSGTSWNATGLIGSGARINSSNHGIDGIQPVLTYDNVTITAWVNGDYTIASGFQHIINDQTAWTLALSTGGVIATYDWLGGTGAHLGTTSILDGAWHMVALVINDTNQGTFFVDGVQEGSSFSYTTGTPSHIRVIGADYNNLETLGPATVDEIGIWNRTLTGTEISDLYNSGAGLAYNSVVSSLSVSLDLPLDNAVLSNSTIIFNSTLTPTIFNITNATIFVWDSDNNIFNSTTNIITGNVSNTTTWTIKNFVTGNYHWNVYGCAVNASSSVNCSWSASNYTFEWRPFEINNQTFTNEVYETSNQRINLTITTLPTILSVTSTLNYNGTEYSGTTSCTAGVCDIYSNLDLPLITSVVESENRSFFWTIDVFDGSTSYTFNTTDSTQQQNVSRIHLERCNTTYPTKTLNFTAVDEQNLSRISLYSFSGTFDTWMGNGAIKRNQSFTNTSVNELNFCIQPNVTQKIEGQIEYGFESANLTYTPRNYYFQNNTITNTLQHIPLYLLNAEESTTFILKVQDQKLSAVSDALIYIQRYYPSDGTFKTVQIAKTDSNGETIGFFETETVDYKFTIIKDGITLLNTEQQKVVGKEVPYTLTFTVGSAAPYPWSPFEKNDTITSSLTYTKGTSTVTYTYVDPTGATSSSRLLVVQESFSNSSIVVICNTTSTQSSATLTCDTSAYSGNAIAYGYLDDDITDLLNFLITTARDIFGNTGLFISLMIILVAGFAFIWNPTAGIVSINAAIIFTNMIGFLALSPVFIFSMIFISFIAIILLKT